MAWTFSKREGWASRSSFVLVVMSPVVGSIVKYPLGSPEEIE